MTSVLLIFGICVLPTAGLANAFASEPLLDESGPVRLIFDTDIGNDVDDVLALGTIHALQTRGDCELLAVTITKDHPQCAPFVDAVNTFYGRGKIPIGVCHSGITQQQSKFTVLADIKDGDQLRYPHDLSDGSKAPDAVVVLRRVLAAQPDQSVVIVQVGFSTNLANLLLSSADDISPLNGRDLVSQKVRMLSVMAGAFEPIDGKVHLEYNIVEDIPSAKTLVRLWPGEIIFSGFEIGLHAAYPAQSILEDYNYIAHHPLSESYVLYEPPPHNRPTWDLTSVLYAVQPHRGYFGRSDSGTVTVTDKGETVFTASESGRHTYLTMTKEQQIRVVEALVQLSSQPPGHLPQ
ncbi:MAG: nucleoside hydrolase [Planctomyces sp.]|nr:nucleoside hydrolase [Planctomyces sp.]